MNGVRRVLALLSLTLAAACATREPEPSLVAAWTSTLIDVADREQLDPLVRSRMAGYAAVAIYEAHAADASAGLRSLAGQLNGLWATPIPPAGEPIDGATAAAEAARIVLDSLLGEGQDSARRTIDSLAAAQVESRRRDRVRDEQRERSIAHGRAVATAVIKWASDDGLATSSAARRQRSLEDRWGTLRPSVLRSPAECVQPALPAYSARSSAQAWRDARALHDSARRAGEPGVDGERRAAVDANTPLTWVATADVHAGSPRIGTSRLVEVTVLVALASADARISSARDAQVPSRNRFPAVGAVTTSAAAGVIAAMASAADSATSSDSTALAMPAATAPAIQAAADAVSAFAAAGVQQAAHAQRSAAHGQCIAVRVLNRVRTRG